MRPASRIAVLLPVLLAGGVAGAQTTTASPLWIHLGPAFVDFKNGGSVSAGGAVVPNASTKASNNTTLGLELGYDLSESFAVRATVGVPPTTTVEGTGNLSAAAGTPQPLAKVTYGPAVVSATWHPQGRSGFSPYIGAGLNYPIIFSSKDQFLVNVDAKSKVGPTLQIGADYALNARWGLFLDVKKLWAKVDVTARLPGGGPVATTRADLSPVVVHAGLSHRF
jgi:outer membrane protein